MNYFIESNLSQALEKIKKDDGLYFVIDPTAKKKRLSFLKESFEYYQKKYLAKIISRNDVLNYMAEENVYFACNAEYEKKVAHKLNADFGRQNRLFDNFDFTNIKSFTPFRKVAEKMLPKRFSEHIYQPEDQEVFKELDYYFYQTNLAKKYFEIRNGVMGRDYSTKISKYLSLGRLNVRFLFNYIKDYEEKMGANKSTYWLVFELLWREFFYWSYQEHQKKFFSLNGLSDDLDFSDFNEKEDYGFLFKDDPFMLACYGELRESGFISNRFRQVFASSFIHYYQRDWREGAFLFEQLLVDYDVFSNWGNWQYLAGVGHDPRSRVFNVLKQIKNYDQDYSYIKLWSPFDSEVQIETKLEKIYSSFPLD